MSEKCHNMNKNNSDNPLTCRRTDGGKNETLRLASILIWKNCMRLEMKHDWQIVYNWVRQECVSALRQPYVYVYGAQKYLKGF